MEKNKNLIICILAICFIGSLSIALFFKINSIKNNRENKDYLVAEKAINDSLILDKYIIIKKLEERQKILIDSLTNIFDSYQLKNAENKTKTNEKDKIIKHYTPKQRNAVYDSIYGTTY